VLRCFRTLGCGTRSRVEYGGTYARQQQSFPDLVSAVLLAVALVLLFEFLDLSVPIAALASVVLSRSGVVLAVLVTRTTFNIRSLTGLIMVIGIAAEDGICRWIPIRSFAVRGRSRERQGQGPGRHQKKTGASGGNEGLALIAGTLSLGEPAPRRLQPRTSAAIDGLLIAMVQRMVRRPMTTPAVYSWPTDRNCTRDRAAFNGVLKNVFHDFRRI
jgi:AcrB/AcrD/AcrF family